MVETNSEMEEIWAIFAQEGHDNLAAVEDTLIRLEKDLTNPDHIATLFRALHTFKGTVRMMDYSTTEVLAHHAEDLVALVRDEAIPLDEEMIELLLGAMDRMRYNLDYILAYKKDVDIKNDDDINKKLKELVDRKKNGKTNPGKPKIEAVSPSTPAIKETKKNTKKGPMVNKPVEESPMLPKDPEPEPVLMAEDKPKEETAAGEEEKGPVPEALIFEPFVLGNDPEYVNMFMEMARSEMERLHAGLGRIKHNEQPGEPSDLSNGVKEPALSLLIAAERMGFGAICSILEKIMALVNGDHQALNQEQLDELSGQENLLKNELDKIQKPGAETIPSETKQILLSDLFSKWYSFRLTSDIDQLEDVVNQLTQVGMQTHSETSDQQKMLAEDLSNILGVIYQNCIYYHFDQAARLTLALEDLSIRVRQEEIFISTSFLSLLQAYLIQLRETFLHIGEDQSNSTPTYKAMVSLTQQMINATSKSPVLRVTRSLVDALAISNKFKETLTNENLVEINQALRTGSKFFTIIANLDENDDLGLAFQKWVKSGIISPITNIATECDNHCEYDFFVASSQDLATIEDSLIEVDPKHEYLKITEIGLMDTVNPALMPEELIYKSTNPKINSYLQIEEALPVDAIAELTEMIGSLVADQATVQRVISRLSEIDPTEKILRFLKTNLSENRIENKVWEKLSHDIESLWETWETDISTINQTEVKQNAALIQLQEKTRSLGLRSAGKILDPLPKISQSLAIRQGKQIVMTCEGAETELDQRSSSLLSDTIQSLIAYCISESIEMPDQRQKSGKAVIAKLSVKVSRNENHSMVTIEDDGVGLDQEKIKQRANELGWKNKNNNNDELINWIFKPEFYPPTGTKINLAALAEGLEARHGKLTLTNHPQKGLRFSIKLPLDTVVLDGMVVKVGNVLYIVPVNTIQRIIQPTEENLVNSAAGEIGTLLNIEGKIYPVCRLNQQNSEALETGSQHNRLMVIIEKEPQDIALEVNELIGRQSILVQPLSGQLVNTKNAIGCALLGEGEVGMVLNLDSL